MGTSVLWAALGQEQLELGVEAARQVSREQMNDDPMNASPALISVELQT